MRTLTDLLTYEMAELLSSQQMILQVNPYLVERASALPFKALLSECGSNAQTHAMRLQCSFDALSYSPKEMPCAALRALLDQASSEGHDIEDPMLRDAFLIGVLQKIQHLSIASYRLAHTYASRLDQIEVASLLQDTLAEKIGADLRLSMLVKPPRRIQLPRHSEGVA